MLKKRLLYIVCATVLVAVSANGGRAAVMPQDTVEVVTVADTYVKEGLWRKIYNYFAESNQVKEEKRFDISVIGGPHYATDTKFGIGIVAAGVYSTNRGDSLTPKSNVSLFGDVTTTGFYMLGIRGNNIFTREKWRIDYTLYFFSFPSSFWGIGFSNGDDDLNSTDYLRLQSQIKADFLYRIGKGFYIGPTVSYDYSKGKDLSERAAELLDGEPKSTSYAGLGAVVTYDSRDFIPNAYKGFYLKLIQKGYTDFSGKPFFNTTVTSDFYQKVWKGGILAFDFFGEFQYGKVPWTMASKLGGSYRMRGYYEGRYRDNNSMSLQMEYRQKIYNRHGIAAWVGCGTVWGPQEKFSWSRILPNYGIGYRWEFKNRMNVRLDYGFGKRGQSGFMFSINEAF